MSSNIAAMKRTHSEYIDNITAVKGEAYAEFSKHVTFVIAAGDTLNFTIRTGEHREEACAVLVDFTSKIITMIAEKTGIPLGDVMAALDDARTMMEAVTNAGDLPIIHSA